MGERLRKPDHAQLNLLVEVWAPWVCECHRRKDSPGRKVLVFRVLKRWEWDVAGCNVGRGGQS